MRSQIIDQVGVLPTLSNQEEAPNTAIIRASPSDIDSDEEKVKKQDDNEKADISLQNIPNDKSNLHASGEDFPWRWKLTALVLGVFLSG